MVDWHVSKLPVLYELIVGIILLVQVRIVSCTRNISLSNITYINIEQVLIVIKWMTEFIDTFLCNKWEKIHRHRRHQQKLSIRKVSYRYQKMNNNCITCQHKRNSGFWQGRSNCHFPIIRDDNDIYSNPNDCGVDDHLKHYHQ